MSVVGLMAVIWRGNFAKRRRGCSPLLPAICGYLTSSAPFHQAARYLFIAETVGLATWGVRCLLVSFQGPPNHQIAVSSPCLVLCACIIT